MNEKKSRKKEKLESWKENPSLWIWKRKLWKEKVFSREKKRGYCSRQTFHPKKGVWEKIKDEEMEIREYFEEEYTAED